ncbi:MAG: hypothetical protein RXS25_25865, partial [Paraburkholderia sp.]|uniref:hypothetical protein n=1 Tax=Paraburkholderia sp. TaxID=1926495 RepID=UPI00397D81A5
RAIERRAERACPRRSKNPGFMQKSRPEQWVRLRMTGGPPPEGHTRTTPRQHHGHRAAPIKNIIGDEE